MTSRRTSERVSREIAVSRLSGDPSTLEVRFIRFLDGRPEDLEGDAHAAGAHIPLEVDATVTALGDEFEIAATALADHRQLGMTWSPLRILRAPSKLIVRRRLVREEDAR